MRKMNETGGGWWQLLRIESGTEVWRFYGRADFKMIFRRLCYYLWKRGVWHHVLYVTSQCMLSSRRHYLFHKNRWLRTGNFINFSIISLTNLPSKYLITFDLRGLLLQTLHGNFDSSTRTLNNRWRFLAHWRSCDKIRILFFDRFLTLNTLNYAEETIINWIQCWLPNRWRLRM